MVKPYRYMVNWHNQEVEEDEDGDLVEWIDYQELAERCERLEAALRGVIAEADRDTAPFIAARKLLSQATHV